MPASALFRAEDALRASSAEEASALFFASASDVGATYLQTRVYRRPAGMLTAQSHFAAGGVVTRIAPQGWPGSAAFNYVCFDCNPLLAAIREGRTRYRFSDFAPLRDHAFGTYWEALGEAQIGDGLCATSYGPGGAIASLHLGIPDPQVTADDAFMLQTAGLVLTERLLSFAQPSGNAPPHLSPRERDSLAFVAEGKTDWEISVILGVSEATARFHVDNARRKLGAVNRAQAAARLVSHRLI